MRIALIRGGYVDYYGDWSCVPDSSINRLALLFDDYSDIDMVLFPEFAFAGIDGGTVDTRPQVYFTYDSFYGFLPQPWDSLDPSDIRAAQCIDTLRYLAYENNCYIWASSCCERIHGSSYSYNSIPLISPDGRIYRIRRKTWYSSHEDARDTTVHPDTILTHSGKEVIAMTTICYENAAIPGLLDPVSHPAPLWLLPHGTWLTGFENTTAATQRWRYYSELPNLSSFSMERLWGIVMDGWVRGDATMISCDIFSSSWGALRIDNAARTSTAWEPLAWVIVAPEYVIIDCDVPATDELPTMVIRTAPPAENAKQLVALPEISTGPVFLFGVRGNSVNVYDPDGALVDNIAANDGKAIWHIDSSRMVKYGEWTFDDGYGSAGILLIR